MRSTRSVILLTAWASTAAAAMGPVLTSPAWRFLEAPDTFPRVRDVGIISADPQLQSVLFIEQARRHARAHLDYCLFDDLTLPQAYIALAAGGPGGTGSGTPSDPYLLSAASAQERGVQLIEAVEVLQAVHPAGVVIWLSPEFADWEASIRIPDDRNISLSAAHTHLRGWDPEATGARPLLHKWDDLSLAWTPAVDPASGRTYHSAAYAGTAKARLAVGVPVDDPMDQRYREGLFIQTKTLAQFLHLVFLNTTNVYHIDAAADRLYVHVRDDRHPATLPLQICDATANIVRLAGDGTGVAGLHLNGGDQANSSYVVKADVGGRAYFVADCFVEEAFKHQIGLVGAKATGSTLLSINNDVGGGAADASGMTNEVAYADAGDLDYVVVGNHYFGAARGPERTRSRLLYSHGASNAPHFNPPLGSIVMADITADVKGFTSIASICGIANGGTQAGQVRGVAGFDITNEVWGWGTRTASGADLTSTSALDPVVGALSCPVADSAGVPHAQGRIHLMAHTYHGVNQGAFNLVATGGAGRLVNVDMRLSLPVPSDDTAPGNDRAIWMRFQNPALDAEFHHCGFTAAYVGGDEPFTFFQHAQGTVRFYGCTFAAAGPASFTLSSGNALDRPPTDGAGGMFRCAFFGLPLSQYDATVAPVTLASFNAEATPLVGSPLVLPDGVLPLQPRDDAFGVRRLPNYDTIGPRGCQYGGQLPRQAR